MSKDSKRNSDADSREAASNRRKRRAERNRMRTIKHVHKLLDQVQDGVGNGFSHHGWSNAAAALGQVSQFLTPEEHTAIGVSWRETYASDITGAQLQAVVGRIKGRIEGESNKTASPEFSHLLQY